MKVVINKCFGGFGLSDKAVDWLTAKGVDDAGAYTFDDDRSNPLLVECVETLGDAEASGTCAKLKVVEVPDDVQWDISEYDGRETIVERHRSWG